MRACVEQWRGRQGSRTGSRGCHCNSSGAPRLFGSIVPCDATERIVSQPPPERVRRVTFELLEVMLAAVRGQWLQHINWRSRAGVASGGAHTASSGRACFHGVRAKAAGAWEPPRKFRGLDCQNDRFPGRNHDVAHRWTRQLFTKSADTSGDPLVCTPSGSAHSLRMCRSSKKNRI